ncbi:hypothetical protein BV20DRAFT_960696 [Pilatotrama ljubarskyi]|nr:hypothetical protein BV20DRAFT_960696 [Pilatotrama ljubarskyi]
MLSKLSFVAALALAPWTSALFLQLPVDWHSSSQVNITWSHNSTDPIFTLRLVNSNQFHDTFAIAGNLDPSADFASFELPVVPEGQYTLQAINVTNQNQVYDQTPEFTVGAPLSTTSSSASSTASVSASGSASASVTGSATLTVPASSATSSGFGVTVSASSTPAGASGSNTGSATSASDSSVPSSFNGSGNGAASLPRLTPWAIAALGMVAGAAAAL